MKKVFILGTGRCGTKSFTKIFAKVTNTFSMHEGIYHKDGKKISIGDLKEINKYIYYESKDWKKSIEEIRSSKGEAQKIVANLFRKRLDLIKECENNNLHYVDINPYGYWAIHHIIRHYPDAKFVHLIRNGYDVVKSYYLRKKTTYSDHIEESKYSSIRTSAGKYLSGKPIPRDVKNKNLWKNYDRVQKISWFWAEVNRIIDSELNNVSDNNKFLFKLEDLSNSTLSELLSGLEIEGTFDIDVSLVKSNTSARKFGKNALEDIWTSENVDKFNKIAGKAMTHFGYNLSI
tara:strand:- start:11 stop:877 length:867 start_codon:yes stop_codon:yes gene_type:complete